MRKVVSPPAATDSVPPMSEAEREYRRTEAADALAHFSDVLVSFLSHARDPGLKNPTVKEVRQELPADDNPRQDGIVALETLRRLDEVLLADMLANGETSVREVKIPPPQAPPDPRMGAGRQGVRGRRLSDAQIRAIANEDQPTSDDLGGEDFDAYIRRMAALDGSSSDEDVAESAHGIGDLPLYHDEPSVRPDVRFRTEVRKLCRTVCGACTARAKVLIAAGATTEELLADLAKHVEEHARRLKTPGEGLQN